MFRSSFDVIAPHGHPTVAAAGVRPGHVMPLDLFCDLGHILFSPEGNLRAMGDAALDRIGRKRCVMMTLPSIYDVCRCVGKSDWIALFPRQYAEMAAPELGLDWFKPPMPMHTPLIVGAWHKRASDNPAHRWMLDQIAAILQPLNEGEELLPA
jgi:DNA-binding transcriptional LysR family regulator